MVKVLPSYHSEGAKLWPQFYTDVDTVNLLWIRPTVSTVNTVFATHEWSNSLSLKTLDFSYQLRGELGLVHVWKAINCSSVHLGLGNAWGIAAVSQ